MDIKAKLRKQQVKMRLARRKYMVAKAKNESEMAVKILYARWSQLSIVCNLWEEAVKKLD
jgi:hypothetical protein